MKRSRLPKKRMSRKAYRRLRNVYDYIESEMGIKLTSTDKWNIGLNAQRVGGSAKILDYLLLEYPDADIRGVDDTELEEILNA